MTTNLIKVKNTTILELISYYGNTPIYFGERKKHNRFRHYLYLFLNLDMLSDVFIYILLLIDRVIHAEIIICIFIT